MIGWRNRGKMALLLLLMAGAGCGRVWPGRFGQSASVQPPPLSSLTVNVSEFVVGTSEQATLTVSLIDEQGQALVGVTPVLGVSGSQNTVNCSPSNLAGSATCTVSSAVAESKTVTLVDPPLTTSSVVVTALPANSFRYVWKAQNTATLPLVLGRSYNFTVYWGDGTSDQITSPLDSDRTHTYASPGDKSITLVGTFDHFQFATNPERILDVTRWGSTTWGSMNGMFKNATNLVNFSATDVPDTSAVSDFSEIFMGATLFNGDVTQWNTAAATNMRRMFRGAVAFNQDISSKGGGIWEVSSVSDFSEMFSADISDFSVLFTPAYTSMAFNQNLSNWATIHAVNFSRMFAGCESFNQNLGSWFTVNATDMSFMFMHAKVFNSDLIASGNSWNVSNVTTFEGMFQGATAFNGDITNWHPLNALTLRRMFAQAAAFNQNIQTWDTNAVTSLYETFYGATAFNQPIGAWNTGSNLSLYRTFWTAAAFDQDLNGWNTSLVTTMHATFFGATSFNNGGAPLNWNTSSVIRTSNMFTGATSYNQPMEAIGPVWNFSKVTAMEEMFQGAIAFNQDLSSWDTSLVQSMVGMFDGATGFNGRVETWSTSNVLSFYRMFLNAVNFNQPVGTWDVSKATNMASIFYNARTFNQDVSTWNPSAATTMSRMFIGAEVFNQGENCGDTNLAKTSNWSTAMVTNMDRMFEDAVCFNHRLDFNTASVTTMVRVFKNAVKFDQPILMWDVSNVTDMTEMFLGAINFNQDIHSWNVSSVRKFTRMFQNATIFNDAGVALFWNSTSATDMDYMFFRATSLNVPVGLITNLVMNMDYMFSGAAAFNQPLSPGVFWNTSAVVSMRYMFFDAAAFDQDISAWDVSSVTDARAFHGGSNTTGWIQAERPSFGPGAGSRRMFLTGAVFNGNLGGVPGADALCMADGNRPATGFYRALLVAMGQRSVQLPGAPVNWPLQASMQYTRADGTLVATTTPQRVFPPVPFDLAISPIGGPFWTGMDLAYSRVENCLDWTASGAGEGGTSSGLAALTADSVTCNQSRRLLCVEE